MAKRIRIIPWLDRDELDKQLNKIGKEKRKINIDVNGDGAVNVADATEIQKAAIGLVKLTAEQASLADVNHDCRVSILDTTMIQKFSVGLITKF